MWLCGLGKATPIGGIRKVERPRRAIIRAATLRKTRGFLANNDFPCNWSEKAKDDEWISFKKCVNLISGYEESHDLTGPITVRPPISRDIPTSQTISA